MWGPTVQINVLPARRSSSSSMSRVGPRYRNRWGSPPSQTVGRRLTSDPLVGGAGLEDLLEQRFLDLAPEHGEQRTDLGQPGGREDVRARPLQAQPAVLQRGRLRRAERRADRRHDAELGRGVLDADGAGWIRGRRGGETVETVGATVDGVDEGTGAKVVSLVRMATPPMPSRSATARRARGRQDRRRRSRSPLPRAPAPGARRGAGRTGH